MKMQFFVLVCVIMGSGASPPNEESLSLIQRSIARRSLQTQNEMVHDPATPRPSGTCPFVHVGMPRDSTDDDVPDRATYEAELATLDFDDVIADLEALMTHSKSCWPADYGHYGGLFVRLAWHCSGTYRSTDGAGGCTGASIRFEPERSWGDNANLDKALALLVPIKTKYGDGLSWGDLIVLSGTVAIRNMGGPASKFCPGRIDYADGTESLKLAPSKKKAPCNKHGLNCTAPMGAAGLEMIYVNAEGPLIEQADGSVKLDPNPAKSAVEIRDVFGRMGMNDEETVALVGGGHAFGKAHGACSVTGAGGQPPRENIRDPWRGKCDSGKGSDTVTSGFEGRWTTQPTKWTNDYFKDLLKPWIAHTGPGGKLQWRIKGGEGDELELMRLTTDVAFVADEKYKVFVKKFAADQQALDAAFDAVWYKLTHRGGQMSSARECITFGSWPNK